VASFTQLKLKLEERDIGEKEGILLRGKRLIVSEQGGTGVAQVAEPGSCRPKDDVGVTVSQRAPIGWDGAERASNEGCGFCRGLEKPIFDSFSGQARQGNAQVRAKVSSEDEQASRADEEVRTHSASVQEQQGVKWYSLRSGNSQ
jgi:hypothetical protein